MNGWTVTSHSSTETASGCLSPQGLKLETSYFLSGVCKHAALYANFQWLTATTNNQNHSSDAFILRQTNHLPQNLQCSTLVYQCLREQVHKAMCSAWCGVQSLTPRSTCILSKWCGKLLWRMPEVQRSATNVLDQALTWMCFTQLFVFVLTHC